MDLLRIPNTWLDNLLALTHSYKGWFYRWNI
jgi:hypothetical protein